MIAGMPNIAGCTIQGRYISRGIFMVENGTA